MTERSKNGLSPNKFFGCYLLTSLAPKFLLHTYIGFTVNPQRRIRQHNGEISNGAKKAIFNKNSLIKNFK